MNAGGPPVWRHPNLVTRVAGIITLAVLAVVAALVVALVVLGLCWVGVLVWNLWLMLTA